jgi:hypothetical protein
MLRWVLRAFGGVLLLIGIVPLTPLIWLLVVLRVNWWPLPFRLAFWQTQTLGAALALCGLALVTLTLRRGSRAPHR